MESVAVLRKSFFFWGGDLAQFEQPSRIDWSVWPEKKLRDRTRPRCTGIISGGPLRVLDVDHTASGRLR
jgi:hypothetical protein